MKKLVWFVLGFVLVFSWGMAYASDDRVFELDAAASTATIETVNHGGAVYFMGQLDLVRIKHSGNISIQLNKVTNTSASTMGSSAGGVSLFYALTNTSLQGWGNTTYGGYISGVTSSGITRFQTIDLTSGNSKMPHGFTISPLSAGYVGIFVSGGDGTANRYVPTGTAVVQ